MALALYTCILYQSVAKNFEILPVPSIVCVEKPGLGSGSLKDCLTLQNLLGPKDLVMGSFSGSQHCLRQKWWVPGRRPSPWQCPSPGNFPPREFLTLAVFCQVLNTELLGGVFILSLNSDPRFCVIGGFFPLRSVVFCCGFMIFHLYVFLSLTCHS